MHLFGTTSTEHKRARSPSETETYLRQIAEGDRAAFAALYEASASAVYGFALSIVRDAGDAEDVLQDTFVKVWSAADDYEPQGKPMAWIFTITRNLSTSRLRERGKTAEMPEYEQAFEGVCEPGLGVEQRMVLEAALNRLGDDERQIVMLHAVSGLKHAETAKLLSMPLATVLSKYSRARRKLQIVLEEGNYEKE